MSVGLAEGEGAGGARGRRDDQDAAGMLKRLSGRPHEVMTGVSLRTAEEELATDDLFSPNFGRPTVFMDPRRAMFGVKLRLGH